MLKIKNVQSLYFSPTGNTKKIVEAISRGIDLPTAKSIDLTLPKERETWSGEADADLLIVGVPVYGNTYPSIMLPSLQKLKGENRFAVPVAVCGNCKMGSCLAELSSILKKQGFTIPAAGNFVGEHTCATSEYKLGVGRPDADDLKKAFDFGVKIASKIAENPTDVTSVYGGQLHIQCHVSGGVDAPGYNVYENKGGWVREVRVKVARTDLDQCKSCMVCAGVCPTGAISSETLMIDDLSCIRCFKCTQVCPSKVLIKQVIPPLELGSWWKIQEKRRGQPLTFI